MKKLILLTSIILITVASVFAQTQMIHGKAGDTVKIIISNNPGTGDGLPLVNHSVTHHPHHVHHKIKHEQWQPSNTTMPPGVVYSPFKADTPVYVSQPVVVHSLYNDHDLYYAVF
jgi:hypothetical protein